MTRPLVRRDERGSAVVEFVSLGVLMLVPLVYLVMCLGRVQAGAFAVSQAARESGRAFVTADAGEDAAARAHSAARISFEDQRFGDIGRVEIACDGSPCLRPGGQVRTTATVRVPLPLVPAFFADAVPLTIPVSASHVSTVDRFRSLP
ncbi:pilus assembly protein [Phycicoccus sp. CSK15P-2]|uniref:pilus assembly protein n=1 Tax=Phycicoccus sp. CSK15P-2 TaxID=2807627 RepID=UPI001951DD90|nr:pilus assembly protein [Phycicoccus sp. CSK15P-2]MBM6404368.1 pilus assembly protein [Phycicoccus sp. CSK15P-2]